MTLWQIVTDNSTLPISPANNFWDHLNNQAGGGDITLIEVEAIQVMSDDTEYAVMVEDDIITATIEDNEFTTVGDTEVIITIDDDDEIDVQGDC